MQQRLDIAASPLFSPHSPSLLCSSSSLFLYLCSISCFFSKFGWRVRECCMPLQSVLERTQSQPPSILGHFGPEKSIWYPARKTVDINDISFTKFTLEWLKTFPVTSVMEHLLQG